jgi:plastocyanin
MRTNTNITSRITPPGKRQVWAWLSLVALAIIVLLSACGGTTSNSGNNSGTTTVATNTPASSGSGPMVMITTDSSGTFAFSPTTLTIQVGTTVVWKNMTQVAHTVTSDDKKSFDSGTNNPIAPQGGTFSFKFTSPGTFAYHCSFHPFMKATIIVQ